jgi:pimeloyl-ACP methyl ester carboxylesterase
MKRVLRRVGGLEVISRVPAGTPRGAPLLFVHGAFAGGWCWDEFFLGYFAERGYAAHALSLRGHGGSEGHETRDTASLDDYVADVLAVAETLGAPPVLIGHSMGGIVVQRCARATAASGMILLASVPPEGLAGSAWMMAARDPSLFREMALVQYDSPRHATAQGLQRALFSERLAPERQAEYQRRLHPESQRALFDLLWPQHFWLAPRGRLPVQVMGAAHDAFFPPSMVESTARWHGVVPHIVPDVAHAVMLEPAWERAAASITDWLESQQSA